MHQDISLGFFLLCKEADKCCTRSLRCDLTQQSMMILHITDSWKSDRKRIRCDINPQPGTGLAHWSSWSLPKCRTINYFRICINCTCTKQYISEEFKTAIQALHPLWLQCSHLFMWFYYKKFNFVKSCSHRVSSQLEAGLTLSWNPKQLPVGFKSCSCSSECKMCLTGPCTQGKAAAIGLDNTWCYT